MGRPKKEQPSGSLDNGDVKVVYQELEGQGLVASLRFVSLGKYHSLYLTRDGLEQLGKAADEALKILR